MSGDNGILVEGLSREFKGGIKAVDGIDLQVAPGEIYGFLGPNGAGKSTTVLMLVTLLPPSGGRASVAGLDVTTHGPEIRRTIGAALQEAALDDFLTGWEHIDLQGGLHGMSKAECRTRGEALLDRVGLSDAAGRKVGGYSGGMKRRLDLALALLHGPRVLFLDEPTTGLDPQSRSALWAEVERLAREDGVTVFLTTQYLEEADVLADRVGIIDHGKIVAEGTPSALKAEIGGVALEATPVNPNDKERLRGVARAVRRARGRQPEERRGAPRGRGRGARRRRARARRRRHQRLRPAAAPALARRRLPREDRPLARGRRRRRGRGRGGRDGRGAVVPEPAAR